MEQLFRSAKAGYKHQVNVINNGAESAHEVLPRVHMAASLLKRWLIGTHQGGVQHQHLDYYLDKFTFRFNRRRSKARGLLFHRLAQQAAAVGPAPYHVIIADTQNAASMLEQAQRGTKGNMWKGVAPGLAPLCGLLLAACLVFTSSLAFVRPHAGRLDDVQCASSFRLSVKEEVGV